MRTRRYLTMAAAVALLAMPTAAVAHGGGDDDRSGSNSGSSENSGSGSSSENSGSGSEDQGPSSNTGPSTTSESDNSGPSGDDRDEMRVGDEVEIEDDCDPTTFNQVFPFPPELPPICQGDGDTTFDEFLDEFLANGSVDDWEFDPDEVELDAGELLQVVHEGGEWHTFTLVEEFGGGCIPDLNMGHAPVAECEGNIDEAAIGFFLENHMVVLPGDEWTQMVHDGDRFMCLIHPWMRTTVTVDQD